MDMVKRELGCVCANCGSTDMVEHHHIVALSQGGTNNLTNIVPLCYKCHKAAHNGRHIQAFADHSGSDTGRPSKCDDDTAFSAYDLMVAGKIGVRKCKALMNLSDSSHPQQVEQYKKWCESRGVERLHNTLDVRITNSPYTAVDGCEIGDVTYLDGSRRVICFNDTGLNDDVVYTPRNIHPKKPVTWGDMKKTISDLKCYSKEYYMVI